MGPNLPHVWHNDRAYFNQNKDLKARSIVIYFHPNIFGGSFLKLEETQNLVRLLEYARRGISVFGDTQQQIAKKMKALPQKNGLDKIIGFLDILKVFTITDEYHYLAGIGYSNSYQSRDTHKIDRVFRFMLDHYHRSISLEEIASVARLAPSSFCRFFKNKTQKSFVLFLNEIRISQVCKKLIEEEEENISEMAYSCGFSNLSNFNRFFKTFTGKTPSAYLSDIKRRLPKSK